MIYPDRNGIGTLLIPNTIALIKGGPNPAAGKRLIDYLLSREVESKLSYLESAQMPLRKGVKTPEHIPPFEEIKAMAVDFEDIAKHLREAMEFCQKLFIR
jgi:iron(III) transport system substrate-binding protein